MSSLLSMIIYVLLVLILVWLVMKILDKLGLGEMVRKILQVILWIIIIWVITVLVFHILKLQLPSFIPNLPGL